MGEYGTRESTRTHNHNRNHNRSHTPTHTFNRRQKHTFVVELIDLI